MRNLIYSLIVLLAGFAANCVSAADLCHGARGFYADELIADLQAAKVSKVSASDAQSVAAALKKWVAISNTIGSAAGIKARLVVCNLPGFNAFVTDRSEPIRVHAEVIFVVSDDAAIAALLSHEYAHLSLNHSAQKRVAVENLKTLMNQRYREILQKTWNSGLAAESAAIAGQRAWSEFSVQNELAADDFGISLASKAGYRPDGFYSLTRVVLSRYGDTKDLFPSHPGLLERMAKGDLRVSDESFDQQVAEVNRTGMIKEAGGMIEIWLSKLPRSANAWYYKSILLQATKKKQALNSMENAFTVTTPSLRQRDKDARDAQFWLCTELFKQDFAQESAWCAYRFLSKDPELMGRFLQSTFRGGLWVGGDAYNAGVHFVMRSDGGKLITNNSYLAKEESGLSDLTDTPVWLPVRFRRCGREFPCTEKVSVERDNESTALASNRNPFEDVRRTCKPPACIVADHLTH